MANMKDLQGSVVALVTPFAKDGSVDFDALGRLIDFHLENGTDAILVLGTTGESSTMSHEEDDAVCEFAVQRVAGRVPVIAGSGSNSTETMLEKSLSFQKLGADGLLLITPYYNKANEEGMIVFPIRLPRLQVNRKLDVARVQSSFRLAASELLLGKWDASLCRTLCHRGTLYLFQEHLCFQGRNHDVKEVLRLRDLVSVSVKKRYMSAIEVASKGSSDKLLFALAVAAPQDVASAVELIMDGRLSEAQNRYNR